MILQEITNLVAKIELNNGSTTYYVTDRAGITLDTITYDNTVVSWGNVVLPWAHSGQIGSFDMSLANGMDTIGDELIYNITVPWSNGTITVKKWYTGGTSFSLLEPYFMGIIKNFKIDNQILSFSVDGTDKRNNIMLPATVTEKTDDESIQSDTFRQTDTNQIILDGSTQIFSTGDIVYLQRNDTFVGEYVVVNQVQTTGSLFVWFETDLKEAYGTTAQDNTIEFAGNGLDSMSSSRVVPLQFGNLNDGDTAKLGKLMLINNTLGYQKIIADTRPIKGIDSIGVWEPGHEKYFIAQQNGFIGESAQKEFDIKSNFIDFTVDTTTTLTSTLTATDGIISIEVADAAQIAFIDETGDLTATASEIITVNIIIIDAEMMLIVKKPVTPGTTLLVERGYNDTTVTAHSPGAKIRQSPKYGLKNLLIFTHRFLPVALTNIAYHTSILEETGVTFVDSSSTAITDISDFVTDGTYLRNMINENEADYCQFYSKNVTTQAMGGTDINRIFRNHLSFDLIFKHTEKEYQIIGFYTAMKMDTSVERVGTALKAGTVLQSHIRVYETKTNPIFPDLSNDLDTVDLDLINDDPWKYVPLSNASVAHSGASGETQTSYVNTFANIYRGAKMFMTGWTGARYDLSSLKTLNKPWKFAIMFHTQREINGENTIGGIFNAKINNLGFWVDFGVDYTRERIVGEIQGREVTAMVSAINNSDTPIGNVATNPMDILMLILTQDMGYTTTETTSSFNVVTSYLDSLTPVPEVALSYGLNEKQINGMSFIQKLICDPFNLIMYQDHAGQINVLSTQQIFSNMDPVSKEIPLDSISFVDGQSLFNIQQTGTNSIYNDFVIKYRRNNATDTYIKTYRLPDEATFLNSDKTLSEMRAEYYGGRKNTKIIECPAIWLSEDAERLAKTQAMMYAEPHFYVTFSVEFEHYKDFAGELEQYAIGDIIHFTGKKWGINFDNTRHFLIQHIEFRDAGRSIQIRAFSLTSIANVLP